ncbi:hypothetical protein Hypma_002380 [Hypsizygus marmoreus]|uniref:Uncharacterized protein n=1 Tax=Hypsizygus marmoreus TaxID=39966 RepID=A0A369J6G5_HYPMA|nr:hypothetical protein Hypma_002380 [Hypsizygus marmoreus]
MYADGCHLEITSNGPKPKCLPTLCISCILGRDPRIISYYPSGCCLLTSYWLGRAYGDTCRTQTSGAGSTNGSVCSSAWNAPNYLNWNSGNWDADHMTENATFNARDAMDVKCVLPNVVGLTADDGIEHAVKVPEGKFDEVSGIAIANNYDELLNLESAAI